MFRTGDHVDAQGYCGQFRISPDVPNDKAQRPGLNRAMSGKENNEEIQTD